MGWYFLVFMSCSVKDFGDISKEDLKRLVNVVFAALPIADRLLDVEGLDLEDSGEDSEEENSVCSALKRGRFMER
jgi:hypothetical protein